MVGRSLRALIEQRWQTVTGVIAKLGIGVTFSILSDWYSSKKTAAFKVSSVKRRLVRRPARGRAVVSLVAVCGKSSSLGTNILEAAAARPALPDSGSRIRGRYRASRMSG